MKSIPLWLSLGLPLGEPRMLAPPPPVNHTNLPIGIDESMREGSAVPPLHSLSIDPVRGNLSDVDLEDPVIQKLLRGSNFTDEYKHWFKSYHPIKAHELYLHRLHHLHGSQSAIFTPGQSFEKRNIQGIHLWGEPGPGVNPAVIFHGTSHAREWITTMVTEYIAHQLLALYNKDPDVTKALDSYDFYVVPIVNPDGFAFSQTKLRNWRKNRQIRGKGHCKGTDLNRNWPTHWDADRGSEWMCSDTFRGFFAQDTPEVAALASHMLNVSSSQSIQLFIDWHAFGQLIMYPYGYSCHKRLPQNSDIIRVAEEAARVMKRVHGRTYKTGTACDLLYPTSGSSEDHAFLIGAAYAYTIELRPTGRDKGDFHLAEDQIEPAAEEAFAGVMAMLKLMQPSFDTR